MAPICITNFNLSKKISKCILQIERICSVGNTNLNKNSHNLPIGCYLVIKEQCCHHIRSFFCIDINKSLTTAFNRNTCQNQYVDL